MRKIDGEVYYRKTVVCPICNTPKTRMIAMEDAEEIHMPEQCLNCGTLIVTKGDPDAKTE